ncbi:MAG: hypothetical protein ACKOEC_12770 [Acidimicrobiia bacterium]
MARISLKQVLAQRVGLRPIIESLAGVSGQPLSVSDSGGSALLGAAADGERFAVAHDGQKIG